MSGFTPAPWVVYSEENSDATKWSVCHDRDDGYHLCVATASAKGREEARANARLIAAAPDLLAALHLAAEALDAYSDVNDGDDGRPTPNRAMSALQDIGEVIAKAEGR